MKLLLVRHCEAEHNISKINNIRNPNLTKNGRSQIHKLKQKLENCKINLIIVSPLLRTKETLRLLDIRDIKIIEMIECREYKTEISDFYKNELLVYESEDQILARVNKFKELIKHKYNDKDTILIITHADFIFYLTSKVYKGELYGKWLNFCEIYEYNL